VTQGGTAWAVPKAFGAGKPLFLGFQFSCHRTDEGRINDGSVKALLPATGDLLPLARVGSWPAACAFLAFCGWEKNEPIDEEKGAGNATTDPPQITAVGSDHGR
jgi:hypothetical protein